MVSATRRAELRDDQTRVIDARFFEGIPGYATPEDWYHVARPQLVRRTRRLWHPAPSPTNIHPFPLAGQMPIGGLAQRNSDPPHCSYIKSQLFPHSLPLPPVLLI